MSAGRSVHHGDPVAAYLTSLKRVATRYDDNELTERVLRTELDLARVVLPTPVAMRTVLRLGERFRAGRLRREQLLGPGTGLSEPELSEALVRLRALFEQQARLKKSSKRSDVARVSRVERCSSAAMDLMLEFSLPLETLRSITNDFRAYAAAHTLDKPWTQRAELFMSRAEVQRVLVAINRAESRVAEARLALVEANLRLVVAIAKRYARNGVQLLDLVQEGNLGLMRAAQKFEYEKGQDFARYGAWWIRQAVSRALAFQKHPLRVPSHLVESTSKLSRVARELTHGLGREPTLEELSEQLGLPFEKLRRVQQLPEPYVSLDSTPGFNTTLLDMLVDDRVPLPLEASAAMDLSEQTRKALATLTALERSVLCMRFGIERDGELTLDEVGRAMGIRGERVRQLEARALSKLRRSAQANDLKGLLGP